MHGFSRRSLITNAVGAGLAAMISPARAEDPTVSIGYIRSAERRPTISLLDKPAADDGLAGAKLALNDNNTTGRFINQQFALNDLSLRENDDPVAMLQSMTEQGVALILADATASRLLAMAAAVAGKGITLFNIAAPDDALRQQSVATT